MKVTLPEFERAGVLVVGDVMLDRYWYGPTSRISRKPGAGGEGGKYRRTSRRRGKRSDEHRLPGRRRARWD